MSCCKWWTTSPSEAASEPVEPLIASKNGPTTPVATGNGTGVVKAWPSGRRDVKVNNNGDSSGGATGKIIPQPHPQDTQDQLVSATEAKTTGSALPNLGKTQEIVLPGNLGQPSHVNHSTSLNNMNSASSSRQRVSTSSSELYIQQPLTPRGILRDRERAGDRTYRADHSRTTNHELEFSKSHSTTLSEWDSDEDEISYLGGESCSQSYSMSTSEYHNSRAHSSPKPTGFQLNIPLALKDRCVETASYERLTRLKEYELQCSQLSDYLFVGGEKVALSKSVLQEAGITHILNCTFNPTNSKITIITLIIHIMN